MRRWPEGVRLPPTAVASSVVTSSWKASSTKVTAWSVQPSAKPVSAVARMPSVVVVYARSGPTGNRPIASRSCWWTSVTVR